MRYLTEKQIKKGKISYLLDVIKHPEHLDGGKSFWIQGNYAGFDRNDRDVFRVFTYLKDENKWKVSDIIVPERSGDEYAKHFTTTEILNHDDFQILVRGDAKGYIA